MQPRPSGDQGRYLGRIVSACISRSYIYQNVLPYMNPQGPTKVIQESQKMTATRW